MDRAVFHKLISSRTICLLISYPRTTFDKHGKTTVNDMVTIAVQPLPSPLSLSALPAEVVLEILPYIPYTAHGFRCLCLTCAKLNSLIKHHEHGLVRDIKSCQVSRSQLQLFPSLQTDTFAGLDTLHRRLDTLEDLHEQWLQITSHGPELDWLKGRWELIHKTGLLLLYRLQDSGSYCHKVAIINGLPATSLACLLFKLISSIKILRIYGPDPIHGNFQSGDIMARSDIELAFEEMLLQHGPDFFIAMLKAGNSETKAKGMWAVEPSALTTEIAGMIERQSTVSADGIPRPPTLTSCMRRAFAAKLGCHISQNVGKMWEILSSTSFDEIDEAKMIKVVNGEDVGQGGLKRIF